MLGSTAQQQVLTTFEHPVNEQVRLYLRLEHLLNTFEYHQSHTDPYHRKAALGALLKIINAVDRPDLKSKLVQVLTLHATNLSHLSQSPDVNSHKLNDILEQLHAHIEFLHSHGGKIGEDLRKNDFLTHIRLHLSHPAGLNEQTLPALNLWMHRSDDACQQDLINWMTPLHGSLSAIRLLLRLIRQSTGTTKAVAEKGFFQQHQNAALPCELLRISVDSSLNVYPEFSANKHRIIIRFLTPDFQHGQKAAPTTDDIPFYLRCCRI